MRTHLIQPKLFWFALAIAASVNLTKAQEFARERRDQNSRTAHEQLLKKAKTGRIDVYFIGDSITRRWGATDYPKFLEHWNKCFKGWNAANFGWGGDSAENALWRLKNGELDGVNPKVIIVQIGTNNLARLPLADATKVQLEQSISAILETCQSKASTAQIVLFGIFPRNDIALSIDEVKEINARLKRVAGAKKATFVDLTDKFLDRDGKLSTGLTVDGLHLSLEGYQIWADALTPLLEKHLGPKSSTDLAPPPTGDPKAMR